MLSFNNGYKVFNAFCSAVQDADVNKLKIALASSQQDADEESEQVVTFIEALQAVMNRTEGDTNLDIFMKHHERLNHQPLSVMHALAEEGKLPKSILDIKSNPPCQSCLFGKAHRKPWRTRSDPGSIKKSCKPGNHASVDQTVMSSPGLTPQTAGKPTVKRYVGSQLVVDYDTNLTHVTHLEDFTTTTTIRTKDLYDNFAASCGNEVKLYRADNGRFSDNNFMHSIRDNKQSLELCAVGAHHQNGVSERAMRTIVESARIMLLHARRLWPEAIPQLLWPFALSYAAYLHNHLHLDADK